MRRHVWIGIGVIVLGVVVGLWGEIMSALPLTCQGNPFPANGECKVGEGEWMTLAEAIESREITARRAPFLGLAIGLVGVGIILYAKRRARLVESTPNVNPRPDDIGEPVARWALTQDRMITALSGGFALTDGYGATSWYRWRDFNDIRVEPFERNKVGGFNKWRTVIQLWDQPTNLKLVTNSVELTAFLQHAYESATDANKDVVRHALAANTSIAADRKGTILLDAAGMTKLSGKSSHRLTWSEIASIEYDERSERTVVIASAIPGKPWARFRSATARGAAVNDIAYELLTANRS